MNALTSLAAAPDKDFAAAIFLGILAIVLMIWARVGLWIDDRRDVAEQERLEADEDQALPDVTYSERFSTNPRVPAQRGGGDR